MDNNELRSRISRIADDIPLKLGNMKISMTDSGKLLVVGWTNTVFYENINRKTLLQELDDLKTSFAELSEQFGELEDLVKRNELTIEFHLAYDYGKGGIGLCSEIGGTVNWYVD